MSQNMFNPSMFHLPNRVCRNVASKITVRHRDVIIVSVLLK